MISFNWYPFSELTTQQLYKILVLRSEIFVVDQHCPYLDPDGKDFFAIHLLGTENDELLAYIRLFPPTDKNKNLIFGRVVTAKNVRNKGYGKQLMSELLSYCHAHFPGVAIECSAQYYLKKFYESFGFQAFGEVYQEDGIPHIGMRLTR